MFKLSKKIILPGVVLLFVAVGVGAYFLLKDVYIPKYRVDKYKELLAMCDTQKDANGLTVSCKSLMLNIVPNDGYSSLNSLIITNSEELKEYTVTEKEEIYTWSNEILQYKKLKPIVMYLRYIKESPFKYSLNSITFENIPETYIQEIVNRDIEEIMGMDRNSTTILNSFDFCPRPETLPDFVIKKDEYTEYWKKNILPDEEYNQEELYSNKDTLIKILFGCDSQTNLRYLGKCPLISVDLTTTFKDKLRNSQPNLPEKKEQLEQIDVGKLKQISLTYDGFNKILDKYLPLLENGDDLFKIQSPTDVLKLAIETTSSKSEVTENEFCFASKLFTKFANIPEIKEYLDKMTLLFLDNPLHFSSPFCQGLADDNFMDLTGLYIKDFYSKYPENTNLVNRCLNLQGYIL